MDKVNLKVRRWGNSFGVVLPMNIINNQKIKEGSEIEILVQAKNKTKAEDIFGIMKGRFKRSTKDILNEVDRDFEG